MNAPLKTPKKGIPPAGRKLSAKAAREHVNKKFAKAFEKLSK
jgi:hypothetical protein